MGPPCRGGPALRGAQVKKPLHSVSDHAVLRYLERVEGVDVEACRMKIGHMVDRGMALGAVGVVIGPFVFRIENRCVVTVYRRNHPRTGHKGRRILRGGGDD